VIHQSPRKKVVPRAGYDNGLVRSFFLMQGRGVRRQGFDDVVTWMVPSHLRVSLAISIYHLTLGPASSKYRRAVVPFIVGTLPNLPYPRNFPEELSSMYHFTQALYRISSPTLTTSWFYLAKRQTGLFNSGCAANRYPVRMGRRATYYATIRNDSICFTTDAWKLSKFPSTRLHNVYLQRVAVRLRCLNVR
jgi:hypothetical protein